MSEHTPIETKPVPVDAATHEWNPVLFALYLKELQDQHGSLPN